MKALLGIILLLCFSMSLWAQTPLSDMIPYPFHDKQIDQDNKVMAVFDGREALQLRIDMIRRAKKNIEVEYFIYNTDMAGKIITRELVEASSRGVKVRILVDKSLPIFQFHEFYAKELSKHDIEVRYYNKAPFFKVSTVQFRNHRKLISVDDREAITGGRNIGDDYFDLSHHFNFNDTDIYVEGPIAKVMRESFDKFFEHKISERPKFPKISQKSSDKKRKNYEKLSLLAEEFLKETDEELKIRKLVANRGKAQLSQNKLHSCPITTYVTDAPGANLGARLSPKFDEKYKFVRKVLFDKLSEVDQSILISSPYLINNRHSKKLMKSLLQKNVDISVYTNSLASTDAVYVAANLYYDVFKWVRKGIHVYLHDGFYTNDNPDLEEEIKKAKWGTHTKAQVYRSQAWSEAMIGTYNIDNRSNFYNAEMALFCRGNEDFTQVLENGIMRMANNGIKIHEDGKAYDRDGNAKNVFGSADKDVFLMNLIFLPSWLLKFLL